MNTAFAQRSNSTKRWCKRHPMGYWGKKRSGEYFAKCSRGYMTQTECISMDSEEVKTDEK